MKPILSMRFAVHLALAVFCVLGGSTLLLAPETSTAADEAHEDADGTLHVPAYSLPESSFLNEETRNALKEGRAREKQEDAEVKQACPAMEGADRAQWPAIHQCEQDTFYKSASYKRIRDLYPVVMMPQQIGGIYTEVFTPVEGIARKNQRRVLIKEHGGGFVSGARTESHQESVPIASVGKIKVISIDYREAPEFVFPAASEDVAAVYRELLKTYKPKNIGIYGCSAGGLLTAQSVAWLQKQALPRPGAVGMFCEGASYWTEGDTAHFVNDLSQETPLQNPYFKGASHDDPLAFPAQSAQVMAKFPSSLLIAGTRDFALSSVVHTHSLLVAQGVEADLHIWEGLGHAFFFDPDVPQSREVYAVIVKFFDAHLGR